MTHALLRRAMLFAAPIALLSAAPALAQDFPADPGQYWDVTGIELTDGGSYAYMQWLADAWKKDQEFAKSKGWISGYKVLQNTHPRDGEPDLYLVVMYKDVPNAEESLAQRKAYIDWYAKQSKNIEKLEAESNDRLKMRRVMGTTMLQEMILK
ncbi:hypothetical protein GCM10023219_31150 [Stakelama sediminis]|uniref:NIPSNAP domain-containing protein n=1 Tax=Stakelama sediminis TaxID=463200 RepID=A0A840Z1S7_9SPHN|nr:hypothetical protein [Stakelama sediminis]MBB5719694.1 hypothetical protein [Stakelama sediminis]